MELKLFSNLIDTLGKVISGLKTIVNLPKSEREAIHRTFDETFRLIDTTLNMIIIRLGDILLYQNNDEFLREATRLDNYNEWVQAEREFRLCRSLRIALRETEGLTPQVIGLVSTKDWDALLQQMRAVLATEGEVAQFVSEKFVQLASDARAANQDPQRIQAVRDALGAFRHALIAERQQLIQQELELFNIV